MSHSPRLALLDPDGIESIHQAVLYILSRLGMQVLNEEALALLHRSGCPMGAEQQVTIPEELVDKAIQGAPRSVLIYSREGILAMDLGGYRSYFGTGSDLLYTLDRDGRSRHRSTLEDVRCAALVGDALPNMDFIMSSAHPSDVPGDQAYLMSFVAMVEASTKPVVCTAKDRSDLERIWEVAATLRGGEEELRVKPCVLHYAEPTSPLKHSRESLDKLLFCADRRIPVIYSPAPMAGATAPITIAGHVAQGIAECFCGLVIHQLRSPGAPFVMGMGPAVLDMVTAQSSYNAPEYYLAYIAYVEMAHYYGLPCWGYAGVSDAQIPDGQATLEAGLCTFLSAMTGANLNHDVGYLDFGRAGSLEMMVISNEIIGQMRRLRKGVPVTRETLGLDVIRTAGSARHFLSHPHTMKHVAEVQWRPSLLSRMSYDKWLQRGGTSLLDRAKETVSKILSGHRPPPIPEEKAKMIQRLVEKTKDPLG